MKNQNTKLSDQPLCFISTVAGCEGALQHVEHFLSIQAGICLPTCITFWGNVQIYQRNGIFPVHAVHICSPGLNVFLVSTLKGFTICPTCPHVSEDMSTEDTAIAKFVWRWFPAVLTLPYHKTGMFGACIKSKYINIFAIIDVLKLQ